MSFGSRIRRDIRKGLARGGTIERRLGLRSRQKSSRASATAAARSRAPVFTPLKGNLSLARRGKLGKRRKPVAKFNGVTRNYDDHGTVSRSYAAYICAQSHGSHDRIFDILGEALAKRCLADLKIYPAAYDEPLVKDADNGSLAYYPVLDIRFRRVADDGTASDFQADGINVYDHTLSRIRTFKEFSADVASTLLTNSNVNRGWVPYAYMWQNKSINGNAHFEAYAEVRNLATSKVQITCKQVIKLQNITPNDSGGLDTAQADRNPVSGKVYTAGDGIPRVREPLLQADVHPEYDDFQKNNAVVGIWGGPTLGVDSPIAHPPPAKHLFTNVKTVQSASMSAGGTLTKVTYWKYNGTLKALIERIYKSGYRKGTFGECLVFGFEQTHRTGGTQPVTIAVNREVHMKASITTTRKIPMLQEYDNTAVTL